IEVNDDAVPDGAACADTDAGADYGVLADGYAFTDVGARIDAGGWRHHGRMAHRASTGVRSSSESRRTGVPPVASEREAASSTRITWSPCPPSVRGFCRVRTHSRKWRHSMVSGSPPSRRGIQMSPLRTESERAKSTTLPASTPLS